MDLLTSMFYIPQYLCGGCISPRTPLLVGTITPIIFTAPSIYSCPGVEITDYPAIADLGFHIMEQLVRTSMISQSHLMRALPLK
ncbi:MAG: hypothetical protein R2809_09685 [Flavobacteriales bacterium]